MGNATRTALNANPNYYAALVRWYTSPLAVLLLGLCGSVFIQCPEAWTAIESLWKHRKQVSAPTSTPSLSRGTLCWWYSTGSSSLFLIRTPTVATHGTLARGHLHICTTPHQYSIPWYQAAHIPSGSCRRLHGAKRHMLCLSLETLTIFFHEGTDHGQEICAFFQASICLRVKLTGKEPAVGAEGR